MPDFRAYSPQTPADATEIRLGADESHHLVTVNRCGRGDPVVVFDGHGREWLTEPEPSRSGFGLTGRSCSWEQRQGTHRSEQGSTGNVSSGTGTDT